MTTSREDMDRRKSRAKRTQNVRSGACGNRDATAYVVGFQRCEKHVPMGQQIVLRDPELEV